VLSFQLRKWLASGILLFFARGLKPHPIYVKDPRLRTLEKILSQCGDPERDRLMKARWEALKRITIWLLTHDGAYRQRAIYLLSQIAKHKEQWKFKPYEAKFP